MEMKLEGFYVARGLSFKCAAVPEAGSFLVCSRLYYTRSLCS